MQFLPLKTSLEYNEKRLLDTEVMTKLNNENCVIVPGWTLLIVGIVIGIIVGSILTAGLFVIFRVGKKDNSSKEIKRMNHGNNPIELETSEVILSHNYDERMSEISFGLANESIEKQALPQQPRQAKRSTQSSCGSNRAVLAGGNKFSQIKDEENQMNPKSPPRAKKVSPKRIFRRGLFGKHTSPVKNQLKMKELKTNEKTRINNTHDDIESSVPTKNQNNDDSTYGEFVVDVSTVDVDGGSIVTFSDIIKNRKDLIKYRQEDTSSHDIHRHGHDKVTENSTGAVLKSYEMPQTPQTVLSFEEQIQENMMLYPQSKPIAEKLSSPSKKLFHE